MFMEFSVNLKLFLSIPDADHSLEGPACVSHLIDQLRAGLPNQFDAGFSTEPAGWAAVEDNSGAQVAQPTG